VPWPCTKKRPPSSSSAISTRCPGIRSPAGCSRRCSTRGRRPKSGRIGVLTATGSGVANSGRQADYEFRAGAGAFATGRDAAPVQLHETSPGRGRVRARVRLSPRGRGPARTGRTPASAVRGRSPGRCPRTRRMTCPASARAVSRMSPPGSVNLAALASRLISTCSSRTGSATTDTGPAGSETVSRCPRAASRCAVASVAPDRQPASAATAR